MTAPAPIPPSPPAFPRSRLVAGGVVLGVALLLMLIESSRLYLSSAISDRPVTWLGSLRAAAPTWVIAAVLAPIPLGLARLVPPGAGYGARAIAIHAAGALVFAGLHMAAMALQLTTADGSLARLPLYLVKLSSSVVVNLLLYGVIVGVVVALRFHREAQARALAASQLQASLTDARLAALRGQLNPHFLFNTLNAISTMALKNEQENVVRTLGYLGELLRVSLDDQLPQEVPLREELEFLDRYLDIQRARFGTRLTIRVDADPRVLDALVPSMILQPFVENAIVHGVAPIPGPGQVAIQARHQGATLTLTITDSGPGFGTDSLPGVATQPRPDGPGMGIGLANARARLGQLYGEACTLTLGRGAGGGAQVSLTIPFRHSTVGLHR